MPTKDTMSKPSSKYQNTNTVDPDKHDAWVLRAGAELWKAVVAEADHPADDTRTALQAVRDALNAARRLRFAGDIPSSERQMLVRQTALAEVAQTQALRHWGLGRGLDWGEDWGERWGEALVEEALVEEALVEEALSDESASDAVPETSTLPHYQGSKP